ncbi:S16 family serine protease [Leptotrichia massiliensis]|uniref:S16 family serine protease n=1 Tax=Leptotrichia massiliensis TaxID=1852388 RepID=UPI0028E791EE|nr:S16 family serine protease [Leptotrichia massiliensis]
MSDIKKEIEKKREQLKNLNISLEAKLNVEQYINELEEKNLDPSRKVKCEKYLRLILDELQWGKNTQEAKLNITKLRELLNKNHYGMDRVKETIIENLVLLEHIKKYNKGKKNPTILCLIGGAGIGKTSLVLSIAEALGRKFEKISISGINSGFELNGLSKSYTSAMPGRIIKALAKLRCDNPVILLDEIDKVSENKTNGDIQGILLEILDPDDNKRFRDEYLEIEYDLSNIMFIATANYLEKISKPLLSRMEVITLDSYSVEEKIIIAQNYIIPELNSQVGAKNFNLTEDVLKYIIENYTLEDGVRKLKLILKKIYGKIIKNKLEKKKFKKITLENIEEYITANKIPTNNILIPDRNKRRIGKVMGLGVNSLGGRILPIEAVVIEGKGEKKVTGNLSSVIKEGIEVAITYIRANCDTFGIKNKNFYYNQDIHIHFDDNSIPKDGPSAGIAITTAILSALTKLEIRQDTGFTGEITLSGEILAIGGVTSKIEGGYKAGIRNFIIPKENEAQLLRIDKKILEDIKVHLVSDYKEVFEILKNI